MTVSVSFAQKYNWNKNQVIAHRGAWKKNQYPENSIASLQEAVRIGCYGSEFDVWMTKDSILVVNHDPTFLGIKIETATYNDLLKKTLSNGEYIPTLESYIKAGKKQKSTKLILEIKPSTLGKERTIELTDRCIKLVDQLKAGDWIEYISFSYDACKRVKNLVPAARVFYLNGDVAAEQLKADGLTGADYPYPVYKKDNWIEHAHQIGLMINAWTVNSIVDMQWLLLQKADFITTNEPELLFEVLEKIKKDN